MLGIEVLAQLNASEPCLPGPLEVLCRAGVDVVNTAWIVFLAGLGIYSWVRSRRSPQVPRGTISVADVETTRVDLATAVRNARLMQLTRHTSGASFDVRAEPNSAFLGSARVGDGRGIHLSDIATEWNGQRLAVVGEFGSGKTVAALFLAVGQQKRGDTRIIEIFGLGDWLAYSAGKSNASIEDWICEQLSVNYRVSLIFGRRLQRDGSIIPVFDGLDEVVVPSDPAATRSARQACVTAIEEWSGHVAGCRPYVLTSRPEEFRDLYPDWPQAEIVEVQLLDRSAIAKSVKDHPGAHPDWGQVVAAVEAGTAEAVETLLSRPLFLGVALDTYRRDGSASPTELLAMSEANAEKVIWGRFMELPSGIQFDGRSAGGVRSALAWLAHRMQAVGSQILYLHELHRYPQEPMRLFRRFRLAAGLAVGLAASLTGGLVGLLAGLLSGFALGMVVRPQVAIRQQPDPWRQQLGAIHWISHLAFGLMGGFAFGLVGWLSLGLRSGLAIAAVMGLVAGLLGVLAELIGGNRDPASLEVVQGNGPRDLLTSSRTTGLIGGLANSALLWLASGLLIALAVELTGGLVAQLASLLAFALLSGLVFGLDAWLYELYLERHLARHTPMLRPVDKFLDWCTASFGASPQRPWIRRTGAGYQFRHRRLQEYLAAEYEKGTAAPDT